MKNKEIYKLLLTTAKKIKNKESYKDITALNPELKKPNLILEKIKSEKNKKLKFLMLKLLEKISNSFEGDDEVWKKLLPKNKKHRPKKSL